MKIINCKNYYKVRWNNIIIILLSAIRKFTKIPHTQTVWNVLWKLNIVANKEKGVPIIDIFQYKFCLRFALMGWELVLPHRKNDWPNFILKLPSYLHDVLSKCNQPDKKNNYLDTLLSFQGSNSLFHVGIFSNLDTTIYKNRNVVECVISIL